VTYTGPNWRVDVVTGDYYNVHAVVQDNYLFHNDVIAQTSADTRYDLVGGHDQLGNLAQIFDGTIHYDLIVVQGAHHGMHVIFQNNILANPGEHLEGRVRSVTPRYADLFKHVPCAGEKRA
jgi:hypothetical protein